MNENHQSHASVESDEEIASPTAEDILDAEDKERELVEAEMKQLENVLAKLPETAAEPEKPRPVWDTSHVGAITVPDDAGTPVPVLAEELKPIEFWAERLGTPKWLFAGTKVGKGWAIGQEVTRAKYEEAVKWAATVESR